MMNDLIARISESVGIDAGVAQNAVGLMLAFLKKEGDASAVSSMFSKVAGADALADEHIGELGGGFLGGGVMGLGQKLMGLGLGMGEISSVAKETIGFAKEKADPATVDAVVASIPGLSQFV